MEQKKKYLLSWKTLWSFKYKCVYLNLCLSEFFKSIKLHKIKQSFDPGAVSGRIGMVKTLFLNQAYFPQFNLFFSLSACVWIVLTDCQIWLFVHPSRVYSKIRNFFGSAFQCVHPRGWALRIVFSKQGRDGFAARTPNFSYVRIQRNMWETLNKKEDSLKVNFMEEYF